MGQSNPIAKQVVLVVEDEPLLRMMALDLVEEAGFDVIEAANADEAVDILESRSDIRILFTDIDMPGTLDGLKLAAVVRDRWPPIEIIIVSGQIRPLRDDMPARSVFFSKPYETDRVQDALRGFAGLSR